MPLTARQARFVAAYLRLRNGQAAAIEAGYAKSGAAVQASRNLRMPEIREAIRRANASIVENVNKPNDLAHNANRTLIDNAAVSVQRTIAETAKLAFFDSAEIAPEVRFAQKTPALRLLSAQLGAIQPPAAVPQGPLFMIHIHTAPEANEVNVLTNGKVHD